MKDLSSPEKCPETPNFWTFWPATNKLKSLAPHDKLDIHIKMLYLIGPDGLVNWGFLNFQKMVWMIMVHHSVTSMLFFFKFAYRQFTLCRIYLVCHK